MVDGERVGIRERISKLIAHLSASDHLAFYCDLLLLLLITSVLLYWAIHAQLATGWLQFVNSNHQRHIMYMDGERKGTGETSVIRF